jgi:3-oxoadipate enol-lactonase
MGFIDVNGITLHYRLAGAPGGTPLVFVNSLGTDFRIWDEVVERLGSGYRILCYDKRGHGLSDAPAGPYRLNDLVADLAGLTQQLGFQRFALAGVSVGGLIAQGFALAHGERLTSLVLCDTAARIGSHASWSERIDLVRANGLAAVSDRLLERWFAPDFRAQRTADYAGWCNMLERTPLDGYVGTCAALRDTDLTEDVANIAVPALLACGAADSSTPVDLVRATATRIPASHFEIIAGAGHLPPIEAPEPLARLIAGHLEKTVHG